MINDSIIIKNKILLLRNKELALVKNIKKYIEKIDPGCQIVHLPNLIPKEYVRYVFLTWEPSFGGWANSEQEAERKIKEGFLNFVDAWEVMAFHYSIYKYLSKSYYITDISKAAMLVELANDHRDEIFPLWRDLIIEELEIICANNCRIIPVGINSCNYIRDHLILDIKDKYSICDKITHYSWNATRHRNSEIAKKNEEYLYFMDSFNIKNLVEFSGKFLKENKIPGSVLKTVNKEMDYDKEKKSGYISKIVYYYCDKFKYIN